MFVKRETNFKEGSNVGKDFAFSSFSLEIPIWIDTFDNFLILLRVLSLLSAKKMLVFFIVILSLYVTVSNCIMNLKKKKQPAMFSYENSIKTIC